LAQPLYEKALAICRKVPPGEKRPDTAAIYNTVALNLNSQGRYVQAQPLLRKALAICRKVLGEEHPLTATRYNAMGYVLRAQGRAGEAEAFLHPGAAAFLASRMRVAATGLDRATKTTEQSPLFALAAVLARNGKPADAWTRFEQGLGRGTWDDLSARLRYQP